MRKLIAGVVVMVAAATGAVGSARAAVTLTVHPGQTVHVVRLHIGDAFVCRTATHTLRWKVTGATVHTSGTVTWDKQLQINIAKRATKIAVSCARR
jgi:hypothetical protein